MKLAVENHKDYRADELLERSAVGSGYVGVCVDTGNNMRCWRTAETRGAGAIRLQAST